MSSKTNHDEKEKESSSAETTGVSAASPSTEAQDSSSTPNLAETPNAKQQAPATPTPNPSRKVKVHFVPVGSAPILKKSKFQISADQRFAAVHAFLRKLLKMNATGSTPPPPLFLYLTSAFCPSPEENVGELEECFAKRGELIVHYSIQEAWG